ncbi:trans-aconitate 2-methyltransferase [Specibacter sp. NPDC057265]|uniref:trans-aconitate 2-methyltransferase n=1 Tax=Specibacter sp. NPDC057265 TaxID=3346075 RepID=UPI0036440659
MVDKSFPWEPAKYGEFADHRSRPFFDLTARIRAEAPRSVVDLGCGPGTLTATLAQRWPQARVLGIDSSAHMLAQARATAAQLQAGKLGFAEGDLASWRPEADTDVVVSNAALHWVPGHLELMGTWLQTLRPGAWLAVQVPGNHHAPSHALMRELALSAPWRARLADVVHHDDAVGTPGDYHRLFRRGGAAVEVWETTYQQLLQGRNPVLEWTRGAALRPILAALDPESQKVFERQYGALLAKAYPPGEFGTLFPFRRIFMVGRKEAQPAAAP